MLEVMGAIEQLTKLRDWFAIKEEKEGFKVLKKNQLT